jgi:anti-sigma factor RsiW
LNKKAGPRTKQAEDIAVDCTKIQPLLVDAAQDELDSSERLLLEEHVAGCSGCRQELARLRGAVEAVRAAAEELAPEGAYLTRERLGRLMAGYGRQTRIIPLYLHRGVVAAAAVAAILVSAAVISLNMWEVSPEQEAPSMVAQSPATPLRSAPAVLAAFEHGGPAQMIRPVAQTSADRTFREEVPEATPYLSTAAPFVTIPVEHAFYDPDESTRWW